MPRPVFSSDRPTADADAARPHESSRRAFLFGSLGVAALAVAGCSSSGSSSTASSSATASSAKGGPGGAGGGASAETAAVKAMASVKEGFTQKMFADAATGKSLPYNLFLPDGYTSTGSYPLVLYIADSSLVGQSVTAPLSQYGALIWASPAEQAKRPCVVLVPEFPEVIIDDHGAHTTTAYVEMTRRLVESVTRSHAIDTSRVYGTGQSMGCMTVMYLAGQHPELFAAELLVSGQWQVTDLKGLAQRPFFYVAAGGDASSTGGQKDVEAMLKADDVAYASATWDATWSASRTAAAATTLLATNDQHAFVTFKTGTVMTANPGASMEHMASFEPAYKIAAAREWLFAQKAA